MAVLMTDERMRFTVCVSPSLPCSIKSLQVEGRKKKKKSTKMIDNHEKEKKQR
jgi:hypothetical protein